MISDQLASSNQYHQCHYLGFLWLNPEQRELRFYVALTNTSRLVRIYHVYYHICQISAQITQISAPTISNYL